MKSRYRSLASFIHWQQAERPIEWAARFDRPGPLVVELGCGNGEALIRRARDNPHERLVGIDQEWASILRGLRRIDAAKLSNIRTLFCDARVALERLFISASIAEIYAFFPCPWPKNGHIRHRLFSNAFLQLINNRLCTDGRLTIVTDEAAYKNWVLTQTNGAGFTIEGSTVPAGLGTLYERKWITAGQDRFYKLILRKAVHLEVDMRKDETMQTYRIPVFDPDRFAPTDRHGELTVEFKEHLYDPKRRKLMTRVMIIEEPLIQDIWIEVTWVENAWSIRPAWGCRMIPTAGVQLALDLVREAVERSTAKPKAPVRDKAAFSSNSDLDAGTRRDRADERDGRPKIPSGPG